MPDSPEHPEPLRMVLLLEEHQPPAGQVGPHDGELHPFSGWVGLAAAIESCLDAARTAGT